MNFDEDPGMPSQGNSNDLTPKVPEKNPVLDAYWEVINGINNLYFDFDKRKVEDLRKDIEDIYDHLKIVGAVLNISAVSVPTLKLCCGRGKKDGKSITEAMVLPARRGYGIGDLLKRFFSFFGFKQCPECKRRQGLFNRWRLRP